MSELLVDNKKEDNDYCNEAYLELYNYLFIEGRRFFGNVFLHDLWDIDKKLYFVNFLFGKPIKWIVCFLLMYRILEVTPWGDIS